MHSYAAAAQLATCIFTSKKWSSSFQYAVEQRASVPIHYSCKDTSKDFRV